MSSIADVPRRCGPEDSHANMPVDHYENFPVASWLMPARLRPPIEAVYRWARTADDLADEGDARPDQRLDALRALDDDLRTIAIGEMPAHAASRGIAPFVRTHRLPLPAFHALLSAFMQDVTTTRYATFDGLLDYCRRSANPIGHLMLRLFDADTVDHLRRADAICSALQLANFWQDAAVDWRKGRVYVPLDTLARFDLRDDDLGRYEAGAPIDARWRAALGHEVARTRTMLHAGAPLALALPGRIGWELRFVVQGGLRILDRIEAVDYDVFRHRPTLRRADAPAMAVRAIAMRSMRAT